MDKICVIPGDGVGPEVMEACLEVLDATGVRLEYVRARAGLACYERCGSYLPEETLEAARESRACLLGAVQSPSDLRGYRSPIVELRKALELYANLRPFRCYTGRCLRDLDIVLVRENTEGLYSGIERVEEDRAVTERVVTRKATERIVRFAFEYALKYNRGRVTCLHKANVLESDRFFREIFFRVAEGYRVEAGEELVDAAALHLITDPGRFDVLVTANLYGDILSDELAGLTGGLGFAPSASIGEEHAVFEPVHGAAPDIAGKGAANPAAMILSGAMMLDHLGYAEERERIEQAVEETCRAGVLTRDAGGRCGTEEFAAEVVRNLG
ncbi:MAG: isocitrate/isopropylmalate dehydrogenase family protein [Acidobacteria bacterium]|nr:isocitrate/isopropylmalate dehydrogenase family protein [Acidobacteriota bacterium]